MKDSLEVHKLTFHLDPKNNCYDYRPALPESAELQTRAAARLALQSYTNQLLAPLINVAVFCYIKRKHSLEDICSEASFFASYFQHEFVLVEKLTERVKWMKRKILEFVRCPMICNF